MKKGNKTFIIVFVIVVLAVGLLGYRNFFGGEGSGGGKVPCVNSALPQVLHIHPQLKIVVGGQDVPITANIGLEFSCHRVLHTHDADGVIHVESHYQADFTLGDFFKLWEKTFSATQILENIADAEHEIVMTVDGAPSAEYESLLLKDKQKIVIEYHTKVGE